MPRKDWATKSCRRPESVVAVLRELACESSADAPMTDSGYAVPMAVVEAPAADLANIFGTGNVPGTSRNRSSSPSSP